MQSLCFLQVPFFHFHKQTSAEIHFTFVNCYSSVNLSKYIHSFRLFSQTDMRGGGGILYALIYLSKDVFFQVKHDGKG